MKNNSTIKYIHEIFTDENGKKKKRGVELVSFIIPFLFIYILDIRN